MADPVSWMMVASSAASRAIDGASQYSQAKGEAAVAGANAKISRINAQIARNQAMAAEEAQRRLVRKELGAAAAAVSEAGIGGPGYGSAGAAVAQGAAEGELDALNIRYGGELEAAGHLQEAANYDAARIAANRRARGAIASGLLGVASATLGGYADYRNAQSAQNIMTAQLAALSPQSTNYPSSPRLRLFGRHRLGR